jgi:hypothetical protein
MNIQKKKKNVLYTKKNPLNCMLDQYPFLHEIAIGLFIFVLYIFVWLVILFIFLNNFIYIFLWLLLLFVIICDYF